MGEICFVALFWVPCPARSYLSPLSFVLWFLCSLLLTSHHFSYGQCNLSLYAEKCSTFLRRCRLWFVVNVSVLCLSFHLPTWQPHPRSHSMLCGFSVLPSSSSLSANGLQPWDWWKTFWQSRRYGGLKPASPMVGSGLRLRAWWT